MAKYELPQYQSMYRDTGSVQVNQLKRQEYLANMQADNALATSIMNMDALSEDLEALNMIADKYNDNIETRSQRGDYENMGITVAKDAMDFVKDFTPLQKSKQFYDAYKAKLDEAYKKGDITVETRDGRLKQSRDKYKGIQYTASGVIDRDSYFTGVGFVNDVDIDKVIQEQFKDVVAREYNNLGMETILASDFTQYVPGEGKDPVWGVKQGKEIKEIPPELVDKVMTTVFNRSDVRNTIGQEAELETYDIEDPQAEVNKVVGNIKRTISSLEKKTGLSDEEQEFTNNRISNLKQYISDIQESSSKDSLGTLEKIRANEIQEEYLELALGKYSYQNLKIARDYTILDQDAIGSAGLKTVPGITMIGKSDGALASEVLGGPTKESKSRYIKEQDAVIANILERPNYKDKEGILDKLYNVATEEELNTLAKELDLSPDLLLEDANNAKRARDQKDIVNRQLQEALNTVKKTDESNEDYYNRVSAQFDRRGIDLNEEVKGSLSRLTYNDVRDSMVEEGIIPEGSSIYEAMEYLLYIDGTKVTGGGAYGATSAPKSTDAIYNNLLNKNAINRGNDIELLGQSTGLFQLEKILNTFKDEFREGTKTDRETVEKYLDAGQNKFDAIIDLSFADPTGKNSKAIKEVLAPGKLVDQTAVLTDNGQRISFGEYVDKEFGKDNYKIIKEQTGLVNVASPDGTPLIRVVIEDLGKGKDKKTKTDQIYIPANEILSESTQKFTTSTAFKLQRLWGTGDAGSLESWSPPLFGGSVVFDYTRNEVQIYDEDKSKQEGKDIFKTYTKADGMQIILDLYNESKFIY
jgi:hypothetical protein